jgi:hypothetical protein
MIILFSCTNNINHYDNKFAKEISEKHIGKTKFFISLPKNYSLKETKGPDFIVYYFQSIDSTDTKSFYGGLYFGNQPSLFPPQNDSCVIQNMKSKILHFEKEWTCFVCDNIYAIQTLIENKDDNRWGQYIHAFGSCKSKTDLDKLLLIFETLKVK